MMKTVIYELILHIKYRKKLYLLVAFVLFLGVSCGSVTARSLELEQALLWGDSLGGNLISTQGGIFLRALFREAKIFCLLLLCSAGVVGIPFSLFLTSVRGFILGFTISFLVSNYGMQGFWLVFTAVLPQNLIFTLVLLFITVVCIEASLNKKHNTTFWFTIGLSFVTILVGVGFETLLCSLLPGVA